MGEVMSGLVFAVIDTETTGIEDRDQVVEVGYCLTDMDRVLGRSSELVKPTIPITAMASACHHLIDDDLLLAEPLAHVVDKLKITAPSVWSEAVAYVAHNSPFDRPRLPMLDDKPWLDTLRISKRYLPDLPSHTNQFLRYHLKLDVPRDIPAHRALGDCIVTAALLRHLLNGPAQDDLGRLGVAEFAKHVDSPLVLTMCNFGKHAGKKWAEVPRDYLQWILRTGGFDPDVTFTARHHLDEK
jgi:exodeoxyribonuclease X